MMARRRSLRIGGAAAQKLKMPLLCAVEGGTWIPDARYRYPQIFAEPGARQV